MAGAWSKMQKCQHLIKLDVEIDEKISTRKKSLKKNLKRVEYFLRAEFRGVDLWWC